MALEKVFRPRCNADVGIKGNAERIDPSREFRAAAAPATVSGERGFNEPLALSKVGKANPGDDPQARKPAFPRRIARRKTNRDGASRDAATFKALRRRVCDHTMLPSTWNVETWIEGKQ